MELTFNLEGRCEKLIDDNGNDIKGVQNIKLEMDVEDRLPKVIITLIPKVLKLIVPDKFVQVKEVEIAESDK